MKNHPLASSFYDPPEDSSSRVVSVQKGPGSNRRLQRCRVTVLGKLFTPTVHQAAKLTAALLRVAGVTAGVAESNGSLPPG